MNPEHDELYINNRVNLYKLYADITELPNACWDLEEVVRRQIRGMKIYPFKTHADRTDILDKAAASIETMAETINNLIQSIYRELDDNKSNIQLIRTEYLMAVEKYIKNDPTWEEDYIAKFEREHPGT